MKTDDLVSMLAAGVEAIDAQRTARRQWLTIAGGFLAALVLTAGTLHVNPALSRDVFGRCFGFERPTVRSWGCSGSLPSIDWRRPGIRLGQSEPASKAVYMSHPSSGVMEGLRVGLRSERESF
jgi:hypothetical protein